ncbi:hypothetical protein B0H16DRAFT_1359461 [Mycena metata]|uniref:F-box domain-containing protein n=1 Tax=Mycena metata TaxID=1033252 RepID=A0AAD7K738_9AGAR|nr:hypothetical protein B0H16DRAFT_1359461 [Mycena metata]
MHAALEIPEIVQEVFHQIDGPLPSGSPGGYDLKTLAALARTCTAFCDPALDLLWAEQHNMKALMGCFPDDLFTEVETSLPRLTENDDSTETDDSGEGAVSEAVPGRTVEDWLLRRPITRDD